MFRHEYLQAIREKAGISRNKFVIELARQGMEITPLTLENWEKGRSEPRTSQLQVISNVFNMDITKFIDNG